MSEDDLTGTVLGQYRIERRLGGGGMGDVWAAVQEPLGRRVALKVLRHELAADAELAARFKREAQLAASLSHPNIAQVTDFGVDHGRAYLVMDLLQGESLAALIAREGALDETRARRIGVQVLAALAVAHDRDVVHRDIKPDNVFVQRVGDTDVVKLLDFGIARINESHATMTRAGAVLGTPAYMSPEQARGMKVDARSDLFSFGAMMYEMLSGRCPFVGDNLHAVLFAVVEHVPTPLDRVESATSLVLARAVERAMEKEPAARFADAREMMDAIGVTETRPSTALGNVAGREAIGSAATVAADTAETPALAPTRVSSAPRRPAFAAGMIAGTIVMVVAAAYAIPLLLSGEHPPPSVAPPASREVVVRSEMPPSPPPPTSEALVVAASPPDAGEPPNVTEPAAPAHVVNSVATRAAPTSVTVECGGSPRELPVVRASDRVTFGSADAIGSMPPGVISTVRAAFNAQAAVGIARCYRGHAFRAGQDFDIDVDDTGHVTRVEVGTFCPVDAAVVSCAHRVLGAVRLDTASSFRVRLGADMPTR